MYLQLSWRNIWRNRRRTLVILTAVLIGVSSMIFLGALMRGFEEEMVRHGIATLTGHIQIHHQGYHSDPVIENSITAPSKVRDILHKHLPAGSRWAPRIRVHAIATNARHSAGVTLVGIDPPREADISFIGQAVTKGDYLESGDRYGILIGEALAEKFETQPGRKLVIMSEDTAGKLASRAFRVRGIFSAEMSSTEEQFAFVTLKPAGEMLKLGDGISEICVLLSSHQKVSPVDDALEKALPANRYEVHTWKQLLPLVVASLRIYDGFLFLWFLVVFIAMGFGIVNTTLMAVFERIREFGLLRSLGMKPWGIVKDVLLEAFFLLLLGTGAGNLLGLFIVFILSGKGIDLSSLSAGMEYAGFGARVIYPAVYGRDLMTANGVVFLLGLLVSLYPAFKAARFTPVQAMAHT